MWQSDHVYRDEAWGGLRGRPLRYVLASVLSGTRRSAVNPAGVVTVAELVSRLRAEGFVFAGRPSKVISDALRWEVRRGRIERLERGVYRWVGAPQSTRSRINRRVRAVRRWLEWAIVQGRAQSSTSPVLGSHLAMPFGVAPP